MPPPFEVEVGRKCLNFPAMAMRPDGKKVLLVVQQSAPISRSVGFDGAVDAAAFWLEAPLTLRDLTLTIPESAILRSNGTPD